MDTHDSVFSQPMNCFLLEKFRVAAWVQLYFMTKANSYWMRHSRLDYWTKPVYYDEIEVFLTERELFPDVGSLGDTAVRKMFRDYLREEFAQYICPDISEVDHPTCVWHVLDPKTLEPLRGAEPRVIGRNQEIFAVAETQLKNMGYL